VEIKSHAQVDWPGGIHEGAPIFVIVDLKNATRGQGGAYNAHRRFEKEQAWDFALPLLARKHQNVTSLMAIRNNSNCAKIKPEIKFKNEEGRVVCILDSFWPHPKHVKLIDLANIGCLTDGWVGAAEINIVDWEILCNEARSPFDEGIIMPSAVVVNRVSPGVTPLGDETRVYEGFPIKNFCIPQCFGDLTVNVVSDEDATSVPLAGATVTVKTGLWCGAPWTGTGGPTGTAGTYIMEVPGDDPATLTVSEATDYAVTAAKTGCLMVPSTGCHRGRAGVRCYGHCNRHHEAGRYRQRRDLL